MIWTRGEIIPDEALRISVLDRTFEHGLGLFETFRTWNGHATLLDRHLERMRRSADELGLPLYTGDLPDFGAVVRLKQATSRRIGRRAIAHRPHGRSARRVLCEHRSACHR